MKGIRPVENMVDGGGELWLVLMEWRPAGWSVCLPLLIFLCTIKSRSSLLAPAHPGGPGKRVVKWLCYGMVVNEYAVLVPLPLKCLAGISSSILCGCRSEIGVLLWARIFGQDQWTDAD